MLSYVQVSLVNTSHILTLFDIVEPQLNAAFKMLDPGVLKYISFVPGSAGGHRSVRTPCRVLKTPSTSQLSLTHPVPPTPHSVLRTICMLNAHPTQYISLISVSPIPDRLDTIHIFHALAFLRPPITPGLPSLRLCHSSVSSLTFSLYATFSALPSTRSSGQWLLRRRCRFRFSQRQSGLNVQPSCGQR